MSLDLLPLLRSGHHLEPLSGEDPFDWLATGDDPQFYISTLKWSSGWYLLDMTIATEEDGGIAHIFPGALKGFNSQDLLEVQFYSGIPVQRLVFIKPWSRKLRLDPLSRRGRFSINSLSIEKLSESRAELYMLESLKELSPYNVLSVRQRQQLIQQESNDDGVTFAFILKKRYEQSLKMRVHSDYQQWIIRDERSRTLPDVASDDVLFSLVVPVYNTPSEYLSQCIESVLRQTYANWQLCLVDDASIKQETIDCLRDYSARDNRIDVIWRKENGHISLASNDGLASAKGDWVVLLDHDDMLASDALSWLAFTIQQHPSVEFIYSDEDKIDTQNQRFDPHFKPDWNPDLLLAQNYICHIAAMKVEKLRALGGFRKGVEGSQDHDVFLRYTHNVAPTNIIHIPHVLYHWRAIEGSTAQHGSEKSYAWSNGVQVVNDFLEDHCPGAMADFAPHDNAYRVKWPLPEQKPLVSIVIPTRDGLAILKPCLEGVLHNTDYGHFEVLIVDNGSVQTETLEYFSDIQQRDSRVRVLPHPGAFNYSAINNAAVAQAKGEVICLLNNDIEPINSDWLSEMVSQVLRPEIGCVGAKLYYPDDRIQHAGVILGIGGVAGHSHKYFNRQASGYFGRLMLAHNMSAVTAACLVVEKSVYEDVGGLNEEHLTIAFNDVDFCIRVREAGYRNVWTPYAELYHYESVSRGAEDSPEKVARFNREVDYMKSTWSSLLTCDPAYNSNLTLEHENFSLK